MAMGASERARGTRKSQSIIPQPSLCGEWAVSYRLFSPMAVLSIIQEASKYLSPAPTSDMGATSDKASRALPCVRHHHTGHRRQVPCQQASLSLAGSCNNQSHRCLGTVPHPQYRQSLPPVAAAKKGSCALRFVDRGAFGHRVTKTRPVIPSSLGPVRP